MPALDGVRGVAVLMVIWFHTIGELLVRHPLDEIVGRVARSAWTGVDLFFALSGFLITGILLDTRGRRGYFRNFIVRRALRILPLYAAAIVLVLYVLPAIGLLSPETAVEPRKHLRWFVLMVPNILVGYHGFRSGGEIAHFWSIGVEEQFYFIWPLVVAFVLPRQLRTVAVVLFLVSPFLRLFALGEGTPPRAVYTLMPTHWGGLVLGAFLAASLRTDVPVDKLRRWFFRLSVAGALALLPIFVLQGGLTYLQRSMHLVGFSAVAIISAWVVLLAATSPADSRTARVLGSRTLRFFGKYSYALYIFHPVVITMLAEAGWTDESLRPVAGMLLPAATVRAVAVLALSVAAALASWYLIERPALSLKRHFPD